MDVRGSIQDLLYKYLTNNPNTKENDKTNVYRLIKGALKNGYTYNDIINIINNNKSCIKNLKNLCGSKKNNGDINLLQCKFYYHNQLRILPPPPVSEYNPYTCTITHSEIEYYLEMRASYTLDDLIEYIKTKTSMKYLFNNKPRLLGALKVQITKYDIDLLLFLIDVVDVIYCNKKNYLKNIFEIDDYLQEAKECLNLKHTENVINGTNKIVPKKRTLCVK